MRTREILSMDGKTTGTIACRQCGRSKQVNLFRFLHITKDVKVRCPCGTVFDVFFEKRTFRRKQVQLDGTIWTHPSRERLGPLTITSLSMRGVGFLTPLEDLAVGAIYTLTFVLDDVYQSWVEDDIIIRHQRHQIYGAQFVDDDQYRHSLDFYLMPFSLAD